LKIFLSNHPNRVAIRSNRIVTPSGIKKGTVLIAGEVISAVVAFSDIPSDYFLDDVGDLVVMPGLVDTHVHINEPGRMEWEGFETATKSAAAGGITSLVEMPLNSSPVTTTVDAFQKKIDTAKGKLFVDCGFYGGVIPGNSSHIQPLIDAGVRGFKAFLIHSGIDDFPNTSESDLRAAMPTIAKSGLPLLVHCELQSNTPALPHFSPSFYRAYLSCRPRQWEHDAIKLMIDLCREYNCRVHIVHLSSADELPMIRMARSEGLPLTVETCPHYLYFTAEEIPDGDTRFKCAPPIRERENRERLWDGLNEDVIDFIVSDHSPCPPELKLLNDGDFLKAWGGISSLQFGLSIVWTEARKRGFTIADVAKWMCTRPAQFVGLKKGKLEAGYDADIVVWHPEASFVVGQSLIFQRHKLTPYEGRTLQGVVERTYLRGRKIYEKGTFAEPLGKILLWT
jgi:allantoinase